ncbi:MAG TPA: thioredoxin domain-containing protein [Candidatus Saccharimonadales bacterium]
MSKKAWIIFVAICVVVIGGLVMMSNTKKVDVSSVDSNKIVKASADSGNIADHVFGKADSKVILVEYGDYQCPGCGNAYPIAKSLSEKYKDQMAFVFRNFPLTSIHPNAKAAATAAEAAGLQGKYWEMHNQLYESQDSWKSLNSSTRGEYFKTLATKVGVDGAKYDTDFASEGVNAKINFDMALGKKANVSGTPTFYLNGKIVDQYVKDGAFVESNVDGAQPIWSDADAFEKLLLLPAFKAAGINLPETTE